MIHLRCDPSSKCIPRKVLVDCLCRGTSCILFRAHLIDMHIFSLRNTWQYPFPGCMLRTMSMWTTMNCAQILLWLGLKQGRCQKNLNTIPGRARSEVDRMAQAHWTPAPKWTSIMVQHRRHQKGKKGCQSRTFFISFGASKDQVSFSTRSGSESNPILPLSPHPPHPRELFAWWLASK